LDKPDFYKNEFLGMLGFTPTLVRFLQIHFCKIRFFQLKGDESGRTGDDPKRSFLLSNNWAIGRRQMGDNQKIHFCKMRFFQLGGDELESMGD
jgi:hypothetical protein